MPIHYTFTDDGKYLVLETFERNGYVFTKILGEAETIEAARNLTEDGVPVNAIAAPPGGNIATFDPVMKLKMFRRKMKNAKKK